MATIGTISATLIARTKPFQRNMMRAQGSVRSFGKSILNLTRIVGPLVLAGAIFKLGQSIEMFNRAMKNSLAIMGDVSDMMQKRMTKAAIDVARVTVFSARQAAEAFFFLASAGLDAATSLRALPLVAKFAQAGMFDLSEATSLLTDAQSALGLKVKDITKSMKNMVRVSDLLVGANTLADATARQFAEALATAGGRVRLLGVELETAVAALAAFAERGIKGAEAGTALDITLRELANKASKNADAWDKLGITVFDSTGKFRDLILIIRDMEKAFEGMSDLQKITSISLLGLTNKSNKYILQLIGASHEMEEFSRRLSEMGGITEDVADRQMTNLQAATERLKAAFIALGSEGSASLNLLAGALNVIAFLVERIDAIVAPFVVFMQGIFAAAFKGLALIVRAIAAVATALDAVAGKLVGGDVLGLGHLNLLALALDMQAERMGQSWAEAFEKLAQGSRDGLEGMAKFAKVIDGAADNTARLKDETEALTKALEEQTKWQQFAERLFDDTRTAIERYEIEIDKLNEALEVGVIDWELYQRGVQKARKALEDATRASEDLVAAVEETVEPRMGRGRQVESLTRVALQSPVTGARDNAQRKIQDTLDKFERILEDIEENQHEPVAMQF